MRKTLLNIVPAGKADRDSLTGQTEKLQTGFSVDRNGVVGISGNQSQGSPCSFSKAYHHGTAAFFRETRKQKRFAVDNVEIVGEISFADKIEIINISANGILVNVPKRMDIGKKYILKICNKEKRIVVKALVVWSIIGGTMRTSTNQIIPIYTAGMEFQDISSGNRKILQELIRHVETSTENRKCERIPFVEDIMIDGTSWVRSADISEEGLYISSLQPLSRDTVVELTIPARGDKLTVKAKVQFCDNNMLGFGLSFVDLGEEQKSKIKELINSICLQKIADYEEESVIISRTR